MKVAVVGCGYVGLVSAVGLASIGHRVTGIEADESRRNMIAAGDAPFHEPGLTELLRACLARGDFSVSGELADAVDADVVLLAVQTPPTSDGSIDLGFLRAAAGALADAHSKAESDRRQVVAVRSTALPGTVDTVVNPGLAAGTVTRLSAASNPEFLREGTALTDFLHPDRIVVGTSDRFAASLMEELYRPLNAPIWHTTPATAELAKYASNSLLATLVSFSNQIARIAEAVPGVDGDEVLDILHLDRRLQPRAPDGSRLTPEILSYLRAGCGFGGSCLPKDVSALIAHARQLGAPIGLLEAVRDVNLAQPSHLIDLAEQALGSLAGRTVAVLGVAFKAGTDDLRMSPGMEVVAELRRRGAAIAIYDPLVTAEALVGAGVAQPAEVAARLADAVGSADAVVVTTLAHEFKTLPQVLVAAAASPLVVDGRRLLEPGEFPAGNYAGIGRAPTAQERVGAGGSR